MLNSLKWRLHRLLIHPLKELVGYYDRHEDRVRESHQEAFREGLKDRFEDDSDA